MTDVDLFDLRCFVAVAQRLSFTRAAGDLHLSVSPLSKRVRELENSLGEKLFERDTRRVTLTAAGARLLPAAQEILARVDELPLLLSHSVSGRRPVLYGAPPWLHTELRKKLLDAEAACADEYALNRWPRGSRAILDALRRKDLAFGLARPPFDVTGLVSEVVYTEEVGAVLSRSKFGALQSVSLKDLSGLVYVTARRDSDTAFRGEVERTLTGAGIVARATVEPGDYVGAADVVVQGDGFALAPLSPTSGAYFYNRADNICLPIEDADFCLVTCLVWGEDLSDRYGDVREVVEVAASILLR